MQQTHRCKTAAVGVVRFQDDGVLDDDVFGCFASVEYVSLKNNEILQSVRQFECYARFEDDSL